MSQTIEVTMIEAASTNNATIHVKTPKQGQDSSSFVLPWLEDEEWNAVFHSLKAFHQYRKTWLTKATLVQHAAAKGLVDQQGMPLVNRLQIIGHQLYDTVFGEKLGALLRTALTTEGKTVPIVELHLAEAGRYLQAYPWELLHDGHDFLFDAKRASLVRYVDFEQPIQPIKLSDQLGILFVDPRSTMSPGYDELPRLEQGVLRKALTQAESRVTVSPLDVLQRQGSTLDRISEAISFSPELHIVHIDAHGDFGRLCGRCRSLNTYSRSTCAACNYTLSRQQPAQGYLAFQNRTGELEWISGEQLGKAIAKGESKIKIIFLSACNSGLVGSGSTFNSVAGALIKQGIPCVVAMQFQMEACDTVAFVRRFYKALVHYQPVTEAMSTAKQGLLQDEDAWYRPVLYLRTDPENREGHIFVPPLAVADRNETVHDHLAIAISAQGEKYEVTLRSDEHVIAADVVALSKPSQSETGADWQKEAEEVGLQLFEQVFSPKLREGFQSALTQAKMRSRRMRISLEADPELESVQGLPWEQLCWQTAGSILPIATDPDSGLARYIPVLDTPFTPIAAFPLRVLVIGPGALAAVNGSAQDDKRDMEGFLQLQQILPSDLVHISLARSEADLAPTREATRPDYHILHIVGVGDTEDLAVSISCIRDLCHSLHPRIVFLAPDRKASQTTLDALTRLAADLVAADSYAAVTMRDRVERTVASGFVTTFYRALLTHGLVDVAVNAARHFIFARSDSQWSAPALYVSRKYMQLLAPHLITASHQLQDDSLWRNWELDHLEAHLSEVGKLSEQLDAQVQQLEQQIGTEGGELQAPLQLTRALETKRLERQRARKQQRVLAGILESQHTASRFLQISRHLSPSVNSLPQGSQVTVTVTLANQGAQAITDLHYKEFVPAGFEYVNGATEQSEIDLESGRPHTFTYTIRARAVGDYQLQGYLLSHPGIVRTHAETTSLHVTQGTPPQIVAKREFYRVSSEAAADEPQGDAKIVTLKVLLRISNQGERVARNVTLDEVLPDTVQHVKGPLAFRGDVTRDQPVLVEYLVETPAFAELLYPPVHYEYWDDDHNPYQDVMPQATTELTYDFESVELVACGAALDRLLQALAQCQEARGSEQQFRNNVAFISGQPGYGKTRLAQELAAHARRRDGQVWWTDCRPLQLYHPIRAILAQLVPEAEGGSLTNRLSAFLVQTFGEQWKRERLAAIIEDLAAGQPVSPDEALSVSTRLLGDLAGRMPQCIVVEDLHLADDQTLDLLHQIILHAYNQKLPIFFCLTFRPDNRVENAFLREWHRFQLEPIHIQLAALNREESDRFIDRVIFGPKLPDAIKGLVYQKAAGWPLAIREFLRTLIHNEALIKGEEYWIAQGDLDHGTSHPSSPRPKQKHRRTGGKRRSRIATSSRGPTSGRRDDLRPRGNMTVEPVLPDTLEAVIVQRLEQMEQEADRKLMLTLSTVGYRIHPRLVAGLCNIGEQEALDRLERLVRFGFLALDTALVSREARYRFEHQFYQEVLYEHYKRSEQAVCLYDHRRIIEVLEKTPVYQVTAETAKAIAGQLRKLDPGQLAPGEVEWLTTAAETYRNERNFAASLDCYETIVQAQTLETARRTQILFGLVTLHMYMGEIRKAEEWINTIQHESGQARYRLTHPLRSLQAQHQLLALHGQLLRTRQAWPESRQELYHALRFLVQGWFLASQERINPLLELIAVELHLNNWEKSLLLSVRAEKLARKHVQRTGDVTKRIDVNRTLGELFTAQGEWEQSLRPWRWTWSLPAQQHWLAQRWTRLRLQLTHRSLLEATFVDLGMQRLEQAEHLAHDVDSRYVRAQVLTALAQVYWSQQHAAERAERLLQETHQLQAEMGDYIGYARSTSLLGEITLERGDHGSAEYYFREAEKTQTLIEDREGRSHSCYRLISLCMLQHNVVDAEQFWHMGKLLLRWSDKLRYIEVGKALADYHYRQQEWQQALPFYEEIAEVVQETDTRLYAVISRCMGDAYAAEARLELAQRCYQRAFQNETEIKPKLESGYARIECLRRLGLFLEVANQHLAIFTAAFTEALSKEEIDTIWQRLLTDLYASRDTSEQIVIIWADILEFLHQQQQVEYIDRFAASLCDSLIQAERYAVAASIQRWLGDYWLVTGEPERAQAAYRQVEEFLREQPDPRSTIQPYQKLIISYYKLSDFDGVIRCYESLFDRLLDLKDFQLINETFGGLNAFSDRLSIERLEPLANKIVGFLREARVGPRLIASVLYNAGHLISELGKKKWREIQIRQENAASDAEQAENSGKAPDISKEVALAFGYWEEVEQLDPGFLGPIANARGNLYKALGDTERAKANYEVAVKNNEPGVQAYYVSRANLADCERLLGNYGEAGKILLESIAQLDKIVLLDTLADVSVQMVAGVYLDTHNLAVAYQLLGEVYRALDHPQEVSYFCCKAAVELFQQLNDGSGLQGTYALMASLGQRPLDLDHMLQFITERVGDLLHASLQAVDDVIAAGFGDRISALLTEQRGHAYRALQTMPNGEQQPVRFLHISVVSIHCASRLKNYVEFFRGVHFTLKTIVDLWERIQESGNLYRETRARIQRLLAVFSRSDETDINQLNLIVHCLDWLTSTYTMVGDSQFAQYVAGIRQIFERKLALQRGKVEAQTLMVARLPEVDVQAVFTVQHTYSARTLDELPAGLQERMRQEDRARPGSIKAILDEMRQGEWEWTETIPASGNGYYELKKKQRYVYQHSNRGWR
jgi:tetratricopeptide (TPR) repeat protein